jgi:hypothetical protein
METAAMTPGRRRSGRGRLAIGGAIMVAAIAVSGCNTSAFTKVELVVYFKPNAPTSDHAAALKACAHAAPNATPEPIVKSTLVSDSVGDVRFRIDHANDKDIALLSECLNQQPGVLGIDTPDLTD